MAEEKKVKPATETPEADAAKKVRKPKVTRKQQLKNQL